MGNDATRGGWRFSEWLARGLQGNRSGMSHTVPHRLVAVVRAIPPVACVLVAAIGALVLVGWAFDVETLKSLLHPNEIAMNPATAVCFILAAAALWLLRRETAPHLQRLAAVAL